MSSRSLSPSSVIALVLAVSVCNLNVVNLGDSTVDFTLTDGTLLMTVPPGGSSTVRPFLALPPNEVGYTSRDGGRTEFVWVIRKN